MGNILSVVLATFAICCYGEGQNLELEEAKARRDAVFREASRILYLMAQSEEDEKRRLSQNQKQKKVPKPDQKDKPKK